LSENNRVNILVIVSKRGVTVEVVTSNPELAKYLLKHGFRSKTTLCLDPERLSKFTPCRYEKTFTHDFEARYFIKQLELKAAELGLETSTRVVQSISLNLRENK